MLLLFAQVESDSNFFHGVSGSGWTAASILVLVLFWFGKIYLPNKDKRDLEQFNMVLAQLERKDGQIEKMLALFLEETKTNREHIKELITGGSITKGD